MTLRHALSWAVVLSWGGVCLLVLESFREWDWDKGVERAVLLALLGVLVFLVPRLAAHRISLVPWPAAGRALLAGCALLTIAHVRVAVGHGIEARRTHAVAFDQAQNMLRSIELLDRGINPYGRRTMVDPVQYAVELAKPTHRACLGEDATSRYLPPMHAWYANMDPSRMDAVFPDLTAPSCESARTGFDMLGQKYGPVLIAVYWPFVRLFGEGGLHMCHAVVLLALCGVLLASWRSGDVPPGTSTWAAAISLLVLLGTSHVRFSAMQHPSSDLVPTAFAVTAVVLLDRGKARAAAVCIALSIASKALPGALLVPMLIGADRRAWMAFAGTVVAAFLPFVLWDARGLVLDIVVFNFVRETDSTALAYFLPRGLRPALVPVGVASLLALVVTFHRRGWSSRNRPMYVIAAVLVVLATGKVFHNNYLVWLLPFVGLHAARVIVERVERSSSGRRPYGR